MAEPTTRELYDKINEMAVALGIVNTKMDFVLESKKTAERAEAKADKALQKADDNAKQIEGIKKVAMWAIGLIVPSIIAIAVAVFR